MSTDSIASTKKLKFTHLLTLILLAVLFCSTACDSGNNGNNSEENFCYLKSSSDPCFDPNLGGATTTVTDQTVEEVIMEQENAEGFIEQLTIVKIFGGFNPGILPPFCPFEQSELVIKTNSEWNRFRNSCFFSPFDLPGVDFTNNMVLVSNLRLAQFGTNIVAVLQFKDHLTAIIEDGIPTVPPPSPGFSYDLVSVPSRVMPVDFIRVEKEITPFD